MSPGSRLTKPESSRPHYAVPQRSGHSPGQRRKAWISRALAAIGRPPGIKERKCAYHKIGYHQSSLKDITFEQAPGSFGVRLGHENLAFVRLLWLKDGRQGNLCRQRSSLRGS